MALTCFCKECINSLESDKYFGKVKTMRKDCSNYLLKKDVTFAKKLSLKNGCLHKLKEITITNLQVTKEL